MGKTKKTPEEKEGKVKENKFNMSAIADRESDKINLSMINA